MDHGKAMEHATSIAKLLRRGAQQVGRSSIRDQGLFGWLSVHLAAQQDNLDDKIASFDPTIHEIILFGSVARGKNEPGDIDLMVFDRGFYSNALSFEPSEMPTPMQRDWYGNLRENLALLIEGWFGMNRKEPGVAAVLKDTIVDLHVLPLQMFSNALLRRHIASKHRDSNFFQNAFAQMQRFDPEKNGFVPVDLGYFETLCKADLSDLRRSVQ